MTDTSHHPKPDPLAALTAAMADLGEATAAAIAEHTGLAYSTITARLRALETGGRARRRTAAGGTRWRLTDTAAARTAQAGTRNGRTRNGSTGNGRTTATAGAARPDVTNADTGKAGVRKASAGKSASTKAGTAKAGTAKAGTAKASAPKASAGNAGEGNGGAGTKTARSARTDGRRGGQAAAGTAAGGQAGGSGGGGSAQARRGKGVLRAEVLALLQAHPDRAYKVGEVARLLDGASAGAVANALHKLTHDGSVAQAEQTPATFQAV
jgi:hypothetical protein